jgi:hypothetical protein
MLMEMEKKGFLDKAGKLIDKRENGPDPGSYTMANVLSDREPASVRLDSYS